LLTHLAISKQIEADEKSRKALVSELSDLVSTNGLHIMLKTLKAKTLKNMASKLDWKDNKIPSQKGILAKKIYEAMGSKPKKLLDERPVSELKEILTELDVDIPENKKEYADAILREADSMGLENLLSAQSVEKLKEFAKASGLTVESNSITILIDSIMNHEDFEAQKKDEEKEKPSKKKPPIDKNITKTDLVSHYYREELAKFLQDKDKEILTTGNKKELADRIVAYFEGKDLPKKGEKKKKRGRGKTSKSSEEGSEKEKEKKLKKKRKKNRINQILINQKTNPRKLAQRKRPKNKALNRFSCTFW